MTEAQKKQRAQTNKAWYEKNKDKRAVQCRVWKLKKRYGITPEIYDSMFAKQNGACAICNKPEANNRSLDIDHCHTSGQVRGLLCADCNKAIGLLKDNINTMNNAIEYLEKSTQS